MHNMRVGRLYSLSVLVLLLGYCHAQPSHEIPNTHASYVTPLGKTIIIAKPSQKMLSQYVEAKENYRNKPDDPDAIIWFGRRTAYLGSYDTAITIFTEGIKKFPKDARFLRHRGHRYISLRKFDKAIEDLEKAARLIQGKTDEIEPDGIPNAQNIPISTLHGNIWYHLGIAYYLKHEYNRAFDAFLQCKASGSIPDNLVSSIHWLYMIQRRLGNPDLAVQQLEPIVSGASIIENDSYYTLCKFYKGLLPLDSLLQVKIGDPSSDAVTYGLANWYFYNDKKEASKELMQALMESDAWSSFGYIAAESDLMYYFR